MTDMKNAERKLRISGYKDYIAVDIVQDNKTLSTPFYLKKGETKYIKYKDTSEDIVRKTSVTINDRFDSLVCSDEEMEFTMEFRELLMSHINFFNP